ncbi:MAG: FKBP-type peptidyl-prolyl cis-trans isomerase [bacterium]
MIHLRALLGACIALAGLSSCALLQGSPIEIYYDSGVTAGGVQWEDTLTGSGEPAVEDNTVTIHYVAQLQDGAPVDSTWDRGVPMTFPLSTPPVAGLREGIVGMRPGGKRSMLLPPALAFGALGIPGRVPPDASIHFAVDLISVAQ